MLLSGYFLKFTVCYKGVKALQSWWPQVWQMGRVLLHVPEVGFEVKNLLKTSTMVIYENHNMKPVCSDEQMNLKTKETKYINSVQITRTFLLLYDL